MRTAFAYVHKRTKREQGSPPDPASLITVERVAGACRKKGCDMNPYTILSSGFATTEAKDLSTRLSAWHDAMVAHERRLRAGTTSDACDDECPHGEARALWPEAVATFGARAQELTFLRSRARDTRRSVSIAASNHARAEAADYAHRRPPKPRADTTTGSAVAPATATEL
jgi:hypothetical protein